jgi:hypothetical protein
VKKVQDPWLQGWDGQRRSLDNSDGHSVSPDFLSDEIKESQALRMTIFVGVLKKNDRMLLVLLGVYGMAALTIKA